MLASTRIVLVLMAAALLPSPVTAQVFPEANGEALAGVTAFDAQFIVSVWLEVQADQERFQARGQTAFERGVRGFGPEVTTSAPNYLFCVISATQRDDVVFYNYDVDYHLFREQGVQPLEWTAGGIASIGADAFTADEAAGDCAETVARVWREQNPG
jgi:hypothetical protein